MREPRYRDVQAGGVRLRVAERGSGPPVVLLHGVFVDHRAWDLVAPLLAESFQVFTPDLPGYGESEKPPPNKLSYSVATFSEKIADLYAGLGLGRAALVGHGLGASIALVLAAQHPELVSRLVVIDPLCYETKLDWARSIARLPLLGSLVFKQLWGRPTFRTYFREALVARQDEVSNQRIDRYYDTFNTPAARGSALATLRSLADTRSVLAASRRVQVPTLVVWGRRDRITAAGYGQRLAREIHGAGFELIDAGHSPHEEQPEPLTRAVAGFLRSERASIY